MKNIKIAGLAALTLAVSFALWTAWQYRTPAIQPGVVAVSVSFYPLQDFAKKIGGNYVAVTNMTPPGNEPHDYDPSPQALARAQQSALFIYNGGDLEPWTAGFTKDFRGIKVKASDGIALRAPAEEGSGAQDPHFWLDPLLAKTIAAHIRDGLIAADPAHSSAYQASTKQLLNSLDQLHLQFEDGLATCRMHTIITSHAAFGYLAARYNLEVVAIAGMSPDEEPSAGKLAELTTLIRQKQTAYIFFESLVSPRLADTIAAETGAKTLVFDPLEGLPEEDQQQGKDYFSVQRQNLANLRTALQCQ